MKKVKNIKKRTIAAIVAFGLVLNGFSAFNLNTEYAINSAFCDDGADGWH